MKIILDRRYGLKYNLKRIYRLMRVLGLRSVCRKKKRLYKKKTPSEYVAENVLNREFSSDWQNEKWVTDVTEFKYGSISKAYLSAVPDLYGRNIVAFSLSRRNNTPLVLDTFDQAFQKYPDAKPLLHSDRGVQYTSRSFRKEMKRAEVCHSMSRGGALPWQRPNGRILRNPENRNVLPLSFRGSRNSAGGDPAHILIFITTNRCQKRLAVCHRSVDRASEK